MIDPGTEWIKDEARKPKTIFRVNPDSYEWAVGVVNYYASDTLAWTHTDGQMINDRMRHARWILDHVVNGTAIVDTPCFPGRVVIGEESR